MGDETASRTAGIRLKKMRDSRHRCFINRTLFSFWPGEISENLGFSKKNAWLAASLCHEPDGHYFLFGLMKPKRTQGSLRGREPGETSENVGFSSLAGLSERIRECITAP